MIKLVFLGRLADLVGAGELDLALAGPSPLADLLLALPGPLAAALSPEQIRVAHNGTLVAREGLVVDAGDELAFLPPVSGG